MKKKLSQTSKTMQVEVDTVCHPKAHFPYPLIPTNWERHKKELKRRNISISFKPLSFMTQQEQYERFGFRSENIYKPPTREERKKYPLNEKGRTKPA